MRNNKTILWINVLFLLLLNLPISSTVRVQADSLPVVVVSPGHGWKGSLSGASADGIREEEVNFSVATLTYQYLLRCPVQPVLTRETKYDNTRTLVDETAFVNGKNAKVGVSIHADSGSGSSTMAYYTKGGFNDTESTRLANLLTSKIHDRLGIAKGTNLPDSSSRYGRLYIKDWKTPSAIIEMGFIQANRDLLLQHQADYAYAISEAILSFLGIDGGCLSGSIQNTPTTSTKTSNNETTIDDIFSTGQCTNFAAHARSDLFPTMRDTFPGGWSAGNWDNNFAALYSDGSSEYLVDDVPEVGAVIVWDPGVGGANTTAGHVGIVESIIDSGHVSVRDANWGIDGKEKVHDVTLQSGIHFIHTLLYSRQDYERRTGGPFSVVEKEWTGSFRVVNPVRNIYLKSSSEFVLRIDDKVILSAQRPSRSEIYTATIRLMPVSEHKVKLQYWQGTRADGSSDPQPEFTQTWWPNTMANAAEPDGPLQPNYLTSYTPSNPTAGQEVRIDAGASVPGLPGLVSGIEVKVDGNSVGTIPGEAGSFVWNTQNAPVGNHVITLQAKAGDSGDLARKDLTIALSASSSNEGGGGSEQSPSSVCSADTLNAFLSSKGSPMAGEGQSLVEFGQMYDVDPRFIIAISNAESTYGRNGSCATQNHNAWGYGGGWPSCWDFNSWREAIQQVTATVGNSYFKKYNQKTISSFVNPPNGTNPNSPNHCYCCSGCSNWVSNVKSAYSEQGGDPEASLLTFAACGGSTPPVPEDNHAPSRPVLVSPYDWQVLNQPSAQLCAREQGDPDPNDRVKEYFFQILESAQNWDSGWTGAACVNTPDLGDYNYQWRVKVRDTHNTESEWSDRWHFTNQSAPPQQTGKPVLLSPGNGSQMDSSTDVNLRWNELNGASKYRVELWGGQYSNMVPCDWQSSTSCHIGTMWSGTISWHVKALLPSGQETDWSDTWTFTIQTEPLQQVNPPSLSQPVNGQALDPSTEVTLSWNPAPGADTYRVELWGGPYSNMIPCDWQSGTSCKIGTMWPGTMSWHVKARTNDGRESSWSDTWSFTVQENRPPIADRPTLSSPGNGSSMPQSTEVTLTWNAAPNAAQYRVELWGGPYSNMVPCDWQDGTSCKIGTMWPGTMSWHVKARNASGQESDWSDTWSFTIQENRPAAPDRPSLSSPGNGESMAQSSEVILRWNSTNNAVQYKVEVWGGPYSSMTPCDWQGDTSCKIGQMWPGTMSWHVKARSSDGQESDWSDTWTFTIQQPPPPPSNPGFFELVDDLTLRTDSGGWPPQSGNKLIAHIKIRNGGDQPIHIEHVGVRGRRNGNDSWDIGFWTIDLNGKQEWSLDPNNERPLVAGNYSFRISYSLDGVNWNETGPEINFTVR